MNINILGFGKMGQQISALFYLGGFDVHVWNKTEINEKDFYKQVKVLKRVISTSTEGTLTFHSDLNSLNDAITIESVIEDLKVKKEIHEGCKDFISPYFTNSSSYFPGEIGMKVNGFHFFNPINIKIIELCVNNEYKKIIEPLISFLKGNDFNIVEVKQNRGYIGNYILFNEISSVFKLIEKYNYGFKEINRIYSKLYDGRDIFTIIDLIGVDVVSSILINLNEHDDSIYLPKSLKKALDENILGKKNKTSIKNIL